MLSRAPGAARARRRREPWPEDRGLGLGSYLSQWCGALYLDGLDHFVLRELRPGAWIRYMDDLVLLDRDARRLEHAGRAVAQWLAAERRLSFEPDTRVVSRAQPCVFLGYRVSRAGLTASRKLRRRFARRVRAAGQAGPEALRRTLASYRGLLTF